MNRRHFVPDEEFHQTKVDAGKEKMGEKGMKKVAGSLEIRKL